MAATYVEISAEEMDLCLKRSFRAMRPAKKTHAGTIFYDLTLSEGVGIRVWTSIPERRGMAHDVGDSSIKVQMIAMGAPARARPLVGKNKVSIVKRTQGWKDNLRQRIEELIEKYEDSDEFWEGLAAERRGEAEKPEAAEPRRRGGPPASEKQVNYALLLLNRIGPARWEFSAVAEKYGFPFPVGGHEHLLRAMTIGQMSEFIDDLKDQFGGGRQASDEDPPPPEAAPN